MTHGTQRHDHVPREKPEAARARKLAPVRIEAARELAPIAQRNPPTAYRAQPAGMGTLAVIEAPPEFLRQAAAVVGPGTTMVITQAASTPSTTTAAATDFTVVTGEKQTKHEPPATPPAPQGHNP